MAVDIGDSGDDMIVVMNRCLLLINHLVTMSS